MWSRRAFRTMAIGLILAGCTTAPALQTMPPTPGSIGTNRPATTRPATERPATTSAPTASRGRSTEESTPGAAPTAAPGTPAPTRLPTAAPGPFTAARWDLDNLLSSLELVHPEPFHGVDRDLWVGQLESLKEQLPELEAVEAQVELQRIFALLSRAGRDGHQFALPVDNAEGPALPIRVYEFEEGLYVTAAMAAYEDAVGKRITAVNDHSIDEVLEALEPLVPRDGPATVPGFRPIFFTRTSVLRGLGLADEGRVTLSLEAEGGTVETVVLHPVPFSQWRMWARDGQALPQREDTLYLSRTEPTLWWEFVPHTATVYVRYLEVRPMPQADLTAIAERAAEPDVERVIVDLRQNPGGDNHNFAPLLSILQGLDVDQPGRLFVLTDRLTFSAASNFATSIEQSTSATFAGEPMGGGLNFWNDVSWVHLPDFPVPMQVGISTRYWEFAEPGDPRLTIEPDIPVAVRAADYFADRDAVLESVLDGG